MQGWDGVARSIREQQTRTLHKLVEAARCGEAAALTLVIEEESPVVDALPARVAEAVVRGDDVLLRAILRVEQCSRAHSLSARASRENLNDGTPLLVKAVTELARDFMLHMKYTSH